MPILFEDYSPHGTLEGFVEEDNGCVHFYLYGGEQSLFGMRSCWVRNIKRAPEQLDARVMQSGKQPMLPKESCKHPAGAPRLKKEQLKMIWFEEGDGAALFEDDEILAIIPGWSGSDGFHGYARDCIGESPLCWELTEENALLDRTAQAIEYWSEWEKTPTPWEALQRSQLLALENAFGKHHRYFAIDGGNWPPKAMVQIATASGIVLATIGVSLRPQPQVELFTDNPWPLRRIELGICLSPDYDQDEVKKIGSFISAQASLPWNDVTWLGHGHTIGADVFPHFPAVVLTNDPLDAPTIPYTPFRDGPVKILWMVPITAKELTLSQEKGSAVLFDALTRQGAYWTHRRRLSAV